MTDAGPFVAIKVLGKISEVQVIAAGKAIREHDRLRRIYGPGRWRKCKGIAKVRLPGGAFCQAEVHWYEAHGMGRKEIKIKRLLRDLS